MPPLGPVRKAQHLLLGSTWLCILLAASPLILGQRTLFWRDVSDLHLGVKAAQAQEMAAGNFLPLVDMLRSTGEPSLGNPNTLPLYPSNLLYLLGDFFWAFNAHFWLHWLLAPLAFYWLGRAFGLAPGGAAAGGAFWATGGYFLSQLNFYNLTAVAALAPAFAAAWLGARQRPWLWPASAALFALVLLAGDPFSALLVLAAAAAALALRPGAFPWRAAALSLAAALLLCAPVGVEMLRILPSSLRATTGAMPSFALFKSWQPVEMLELVLPFLRGSLETGYRGEHPFAYALFPGILALAAAIAAGRGGERAWQARWAFWMIGAGFFLSLGAYNPVVKFLYFHLPGLAQLRFPIKFSLLWALGLCLLGGLGFGRFLEEPERRRTLRRALGTIAVAYLLLLLLLPFLPFTGGVQSLLALPSRDLFVAEKLRWFATAAALAATAGLLWLGSLLSRRSPLLAAAVLLTVASISQLKLLGQLYASDDLDYYRRPPAPLAQLPEGSLVMNRTYRHLTEKAPLPPGLETPSVAALQVRCAAAELIPPFGTLWHRRFALAQTADFLDSYQSYFLFFRLLDAPDREAIPVLRALGVDRLVANREIEAAAAAEVELLGRYPNDCRRETFVYRIADAAPGDYLLVGNLRRVADPERALPLLASGAADPRTTVVLPGQGDVLGRPNGTVRLLGQSSDAFALEVDSPAGGVLVARRNWLPIYRATLDGGPVPIELANLLHLGIAVPPGRHRVEVAADRRPTRWAFAVAGLAFAALLAAAWRLRAVPSY